MNICYCGNSNLIEYSKNYWKCDKCGTLVSKNDFDNSIYEVSKENIDLYGSNYWEEVMLKEANVKSLDELIDMYIPERVAYWVQHILRYSHLGETTAEVGCGLGQLSYTLKNIDFDVTDYELSPEICEVIREKLGLNVICGELKSSDKKYKNIIAMDVFEHLLEPMGFLDDVFDRLDDEGVLILQTPCYDPSLNYEEMLKMKPNFNHLLVADQHIYLYSRDGISKLLIEHGFKSVVFEHAYFGDDYDMFMFAFKGEKHENDDALIASYLNKCANGRIVKALLNLKNSFDKQTSYIEKLQINRDEVLKDANILTEEISKKEEIIANTERMSQERLESIVTLSKQIEEKDHRLEEIEKVANERLENINILSEQMSEKNVQLSELAKAAEERLTMVNELSVQLKSEKNHSELMEKECDELKTQLADQEEKLEKYNKALTLRVGINLINLYPGKIGGAEQYVRNTIKEMDSFEHIKMYVFVNDFAYSTFSDGKNSQIVRIDIDNSTDDCLIRFIDEKNLDVMFCPLFFVSPRNCPIPTVASILDIQHEFYPQYFEESVLNEIRERTKNTLANVDGIITISEYSKETIVDKYGIDGSKIVVTHLNADSEFDKELDTNKLSDIKSGIAENYIFYPANSWPHKNHINLLRAYKILKERYSIAYKLVFTGDSKQKKAEIDEFIRKNNLDDDVIYLGYRAQSDMPYIFKGASLLVFPSLFEGFGIPLVEAMRVGTPVACSNCGSIPEIAKDAAIYFDAENPEDIAEKIHNLLNDDCKREDLVLKGYKVAKNYSWRKCARITRDYLRTISKKEIAVSSEDKLPLVSIITPSYNQGQFIRETIESVLNQDYPNFEYIVMDGESSDNTVDILKSYGNRLKWVSEKDKGQGDAVNKGIRMAKGSIIGWLNSDDTYLEGAISRAVKYLTERPAIGMVYGDAYFTTKSGELMGKYPTMVFDRERLASNCFICQPAGFFRRDVAINAGLIDIKYQCSMDYEFWMRMAKTSRISYMPELLATSRMYDENKSLARKEEVFSECCEATKKHYGYVPVSWCEGYADYRSEGKRNLSFKLMRAYFFVKYNASNSEYLRNNYQQVMFGKMKTNLKDYLAGNRKEVFSDRYQDGWVGKRYNQIVESDKEIKNIYLSGTKAWPHNEKILVTILVDGKKAGKISIAENGEFSESVNVAGKGLMAGSHEISIVSNKSFCPAKVSDSEDQRELSFILKSIAVGD